MGPQVGRVDVRRAALGYAAALEAISAHLTHSFETEIFSWADMPWNGVAEVEVMQRQQRREKLPCPEDCPPGIYDIMYDCWRLDVNTRSNGSKILEALESFIASPASPVTDLSTIEWPIIEPPKQRAYLSENATLVDLDSPKVLDAFAQLEVEPDRLQLGKQLGKGQFGTVHIATFLDNSGERFDVAIKRMLASGVPEMEQKQFEYEAKLLAALKHPNIVTVLGLCFKKQPNFIVLELMPGGDMRSYLKDHELQLVSEPESLTKACIQVTRMKSYLIKVALMVCGRWQMRWRTWRSAALCIVTLQPGMCTHVSRASACLMINAETFLLAQRD